MKNIKIRLRDYLINNLVEQGEPIYFDGDVICTAYLILVMFYISTIARSNMFGLFILILITAFSWLMSGVIVNKLNKRYYIK